MKIYKPNPRGTGHCCSFSLTSSGPQQGVYVEILKQKSWDDKGKTGTFDTEKANKIHLKFNVTELADIAIVCQRQKGQAKFFHNTGEISSQITFGSWEKDGEIKGLALSVNKGDKKASVPLTFGEGFALLEWIRFAMGRIFTADYSERKKKLEKLHESAVND